MRKKTAMLPLALLLCAGLAAATDAPKAAPFAPAKTIKAKTASERSTVAKPKVEQPVLGEAFVAQNVLFVRLNHPASITLFNARGELLLHTDSARNSEAFPLAGVNAGFLYVTLRSGNVELTQKLVYTGK
jgi:hypothetical protein